MFGCWTAWSFAFVRPNRVSKEPIGLSSSLPPLLSRSSLHRRCRDNGTKRRLFTRRIRETRRPGAGEDRISHEPAERGKMLPPQWPLPLNEEERDKHHSEDEADILHQRIVQRHFHLRGSRAAPFSPSTRSTRTFRYFSGSSKCGQCPECSNQTISLPRGASRASK